LLKPVAKFGTDIAVGTARALPLVFTSFGLETTAGILSLVQSKKVKPEFKPTTKFEKMIFGEEPIKGIFTNTEEAITFTQNTLEKAGFDKYFSLGASLTLAPLFMVGMTTLDVLPFSGASKQTALRIAKSKNIDEIFGLIKPMFSKKTDQEIKNLAAVLVHVDNPDMVNTILLRLTPKKMKGKISPAKIAEEVKAEIIPSIKETKLPEIPAIPKIEAQGIQEIKPSSVSPGRSFFDISRPSESEALNFVRSQTKGSVSKISTKPSFESLIKDPEDKKYLNLDSFVPIVTKLYHNAEKNSSKLIKILKNEGFNNVSIDIKSIESFVEKVVRKRKLGREYGLKEVNDLLRSTVIVENEQEAEKILNSLNIKGLIKTADKPKTAFHYAVLFLINNTTPAQEQIRLLSQYHYIAKLLNIRSLYFLL
jgi:hypothetical protein